MIARENHARLLAAIGWAAFLLTAWPTTGSVLAAPAEPGASTAVVQPTGDIDTPKGRETASVTDKDPIPTRDLWSIIRDGGWLMLPIVAASLILLAFILERAISLRRGRVIPRPFVKRLMGQLRDGELDREQALELCSKNGSPVAEVAAGALRKWGRPAVEVEQAVIDAGERVTNGLRRYLRVINGVATVTPLLGLLGTVVGMIRAFNDIATVDAMGRPELLAKGISEALLTTAAGLTVAIPALIFYLFFVGRVDRLIIDIDALGQEVVNTISDDQTPKKTTRSKASRARESAA